MWERTFGVEMETIKKTKIIIEIENRIENKIFLRMCSTSTSSKRTKCDEITDIPEPRL